MTMQRRVINDEVVAEAINKNFGLSTKMKRVEPCQLLQLCSEVDMSTS